MAWVIFNPSTTDLDTFLREKAPSRVYSKDGFAWIYVRHSTSKLQRQEETGRDEDLIKEGLEFGKKEEFEGEEEEFEEEDSWNTPDLQTAWEELFATSTGRPTHEAICSFAKKQRRVVGKWLLYAATGSQVDDLWSDIAGAVVEGKLGSSAKVSARKEDNGSHVICVYNDDFTDVEAVRGVEKGIRSLGFRKDMTYKPDLFTDLGIYAKNHYNVKPTVYSSKLDRSKNELVFKFDQPTLAEANSQSKMTQFLKKASNPSPHQHKSSPTDGSFHSFLRAPLNSGEGTSRNRTLKCDSLMEDKPQAKLTSFFQGVPSSSPSKRKHLSESQNLGEPTDKLPTGMDDIHGSSETALDPDVPPLPALNPP